MARRWDAFSTEDSCPYAFPTVHNLQAAKCSPDTGLQGQAPRPRPSQRRHRPGGAVSVLETQLVLVCHQEVARGAGGTVWLVGGTTHWVLLSLRTDPRRQETGTAPTAPK